MSLTPAPKNSLSINRVPQEAESPVYKRTFDFLGLLTPQTLAVKTRNTIPMAAGMASSSSFFADLVQACDRLFNWQASLDTLSCLARLGSGSACRSLYHGFVSWGAQEPGNPFCSHGVPLAVRWKELRIGLMILNHQAKPISSRQAILLGVKTRVRILTF